VQAFWLTTGYPTLHTYELTGNSPPSKGDSVIADKSMFIVLQQDEGKSHSPGG